MYISVVQYYNLHVTCTYFSFLTIILYSIFLLGKFCNLIYFHFFSQFKLYIGNCTLYNNHCSSYTVSFTVYCTLHRFLGLHVDEVPDLRVVKEAGWAGILFMVLQQVRLDTIQLIPSIDRNLWVKNRNSDRNLLVKNRNSTGEWVLWLKGKLCLKRRVLYMIHTGWIYITSLTYS